MLFSGLFSGFKPMPSTPLTGFTKDALAAQLAEWGEPAYRAGQVLDWIYRRRVTKAAEMTDLPARLRERLEEHVVTALQPVRVQGSADTTRKFLFRLHDSRLVESVLIPASPALYGEKSDRRTLCVSTQVGCAMACKFCASGLDGLTRNLGADEIVGQILAAESIAAEKVNNLVFMGMGEPLANLRNLVTALEILNAPWGLNIGARHITISTSGLAPAIRKLAEIPIQIRLAVSLHGADDETRERIMPVNRKWNIAELMDSLRAWRECKKQKITFEYILIRGVNDDLVQARKLAALARSLDAKVNLIPYNTVDGLEWSRPPLRHCEAFRAAASATGVPVTLRLEKGHDIEAACGQLRLQVEKEGAAAGGGGVADGQ
jgi:23S rRNA (adenine2503-C2)-methyltransferase